MKQENSLENETYDFIGKLALVLYSQGIKMSFSTLIKVLEENNIEFYGSERGVASAIAAAYRRWEEKEKDYKIHTTCGAIAYTFVNRDGDWEWMNY